MAETTITSATIRDKAIARAKELAGKRVRVHRPSWTDAGGRIFEPGRLHGKTGVVLPVAEDAEQYTVGIDILVNVRFDGGKTDSVWVDELREARDG